MENDPKIVAGIRQLSPYMALCIMTNCRKQCAGTNSMMHIQFDKNNRNGLWQNEHASKLSEQ